MDYDRDLPRVGEHFLSGLFNHVLSWIVLEDCSYLRRLLRPTSSLFGGIG